LLARVEQGRGQPGYGISGGDSDALALIAAITAKRQIGGYGKPAEDDRDDVINRERIGRIVSLRAAILTAISRAINDKASQFDWNILFRHFRGNEC
jgi:hypothetical protein